MVKLRKEIKLFITRSLAVFNTPQETVDAVNVEFDIKVSRQQCERYDPTKRAGKDLLPEFRAEFEATRKQFLENPQHIPIANLPYRLQRYQRSLEAVNPRAVDHIAKLLKQAAEDAGGVYTNRKEITGAGGQPLVESQPPIILSPDQIKDLSAQDLAKIYFATGGGK